MCATALSASGEIAFKVDGSEYRSGENIYVSCCGDPAYAFSLGVFDWL